MFKKIRVVTVAFVIIFLVSGCCLVRLLTLNNSSGMASDDVITDEYYQGVEILPEARGKVTEAQVDEIIKDHGTKNIKIMNVDTGDDEKRIWIFITGAICLITLGGAVISFRIWRNSLDCKGI